MELTAYSEGLLAVFITFMLLGGVLDEPALLAAGISAGLFLLIRAVIFLRRLTQISGSIRCNRTTDKALMRQGKSNGVTTTLTLTVPPGYTVTFQEQAPPFCRIESGSTCTGPLGEGFHTATQMYRFIPFYHGAIRHPGGLAVIQDSFFASTVPVQQENPADWSVKVQPWPLFDPSVQSATGRELDRIGPVKGYSIRQYREYVPGDDLRSVDWKVSAKRGTLYVREYTTPADDQPLIIVDLPDTEQNTDMQAFSRMVGSLSGFTESVIGKKEEISLLLISGPNIGDTLYEGRDMTECMQIIRDKVHPSPRTFHLYRHLMRSDMRIRIPHMEQAIKDTRKGENERNFLTRVQAIRSQTLGELRSSRFAIAISRILASRRLREVIVYSLCNGDVSHIREIASLAHRQNVPFRVRVPKRDTDYTKVLRALRGEQVEVI